MNTKHNSIDDYLKLSLIVGIIIIALSFGYYFVIFLPQRENAKLEQARLEQETKTSRLEKNKLLLQDCLDTVKTESINHWNKICIAKGLKENCLQSLEIVDQEMKKSNTARDECFKKYPQN